MIPKYDESNKDKSAERAYYDGRYIMIGILYARSVDNMISHAIAKLDIAGINPSPRRKSLTRCSIMIPDLSICIGSIDMMYFG